MGSKRPPFFDGTSTNSEAEWSCSGESCEKQVKPAARSLRMNTASGHDIYSAPAWVCEFVLVVHFVGVTLIHQIFVRLLVPFIHHGFIIFRVRIPLGRPAFQQLFDDVHCARAIYGHQFTPIVAAPAVIVNGPGSGLVVLLIVRFGVAAAPPTCTHPAVEVEQVVVLARQ